MAEDILVSNESTTRKADFSVPVRMAIEFLSSGSLKSEKLSVNASDISPEVKHNEEVAFYSKEIIRLIKLDDFDDGEEGLVHGLFDSLCSLKTRVFKESFQQAWLTLTRQQSYDYFYSFVCAASTIDYFLIENEADCLLYAALALHDEDINDAAIRAIESWGQQRHLHLLNSIRPFESQWLEDYRQEVIASFEGIDE